MIIIAHGQNILMVLNNLNRFQTKDQAFLNPASFDICYFNRVCSLLDTTEGNLNNTYHYEQI